MHITLADPTILALFKIRSDDATKVAGLAAAAVAIGEMGQMDGAIQIIQDAEDPLRHAERLLESILLIRREILPEQEERARR